MSIDQINNKLESVYTELADLRGVQTNALTKQTVISDIVVNENARLSEKKKTIDQAIENQKRMIYFNDNSRKIYSAYLIIGITIFITLGIVYLIQVIHYNMGSYIPDFVYNILLIATISTGAIIIWRAYYNILYRDRYNFDEIKLTAPNISNPFGTPSGTGVVGGISGCIGQQCCTLATENTPGTQWDAGLGKCIFAPATGPNMIPTTETLPTTDMLPSPIPEGTESPEPFSNIGGVAAPNDAFEYGQYAPRV